VKVESVEQSDMVDEAWLVLLTIRNLEDASIQISKDRERPWMELQAKVADRWVQVTNYWDTIGLLQPKGKAEALILAPRGTEMCRLGLEYQLEPFKWRLYRKLGPRAWSLLHKFPRSCNWVWPPWRPGIPYRQWGPPHWTPLIMEVRFPEEFLPQRPFVVELE